MRAAGGDFVLPTAGRSTSMAQAFEKIPEEFARWLESQPVFFVATAAADPDARQRLPTWSRYLPGSRPEPCGLARPDRQRCGDDSPPEGRRTHHADVLRFRRPAEGGPPLRAR